MLNMDFQTVFGFFLFTKFSEAKLCKFHFTFVAHAVSFYSILLHRPGWADQGRVPRTFYSSVSPRQQLRVRQLLQARNWILLQIWLWKFFQPGSLQGLLSYSAVDHVCCMLLYSSAGRSCRPECGHMTRSV